MEHFESIKQLDQDLKRIALCKENKDDRRKVQRIEKIDRVGYDNQCGISWQ